MAFSHLKAVLWDLDNTLYRFSEDFVNHCNQAAAQTFCLLKPDLPSEEALFLARESYQRYKFSGNIFLEQYDVSYADYHFAFHERIDVADTIYDPQTLAHLKALTHLEHRVVTNASRHWAQRVINHIGLGDFFEPHHVTVMEDVHFIPKARGKDMIEKACESLNIDAEDIAIVDDLQRNLVLPKEMGLTTILVHPHQDEGAVQSHVDFVADDLETVICRLAA